MNEELFVVAVFNGREDSLKALPPAELHLRRLYHFKCLFLREWHCFLRGSSSKTA